jgi:hypothetical protein
VKAAAAGQSELASEYEKAVAQVKEHEERVKGKVETAQAHSGEVGSRMLRMSESIAEREREGAPTDFGHIMLAILSAVLAAKLPGGAAAAKVLMGSIPTETKRWADRLEADRDEYTRLAQMYGMDPRVAATELEQEELLASLAAGSTKAKLKAVQESAASEELRHLARTTEEKLNDTTRAHAADLARRKEEDVYRRTPLEQLAQMNARGQLPYAGQKVFIERVKEEQEAQKRGADADIATGQAKLTPLREKELKAEVRLKEANALEAETRAKYGPRGTERETQLDILTRSGSDAFQRLQHLAKQGKALPNAAMAWGATIGDMSKANSQIRRDVGLLVSLVLRNESGAVIGEHEIDSRFEQLGLNSRYEDVRRNGLNSLINSFKGMDRLRFLDTLDLTQDPPDSILARHYAEEAARQKAMGSAKGQAEGQRGRGALRQVPDQKDPLTEAWRAFYKEEGKLRLQLAETLKKGDPGKIRVHDLVNGYREYDSETAKKALSDNFSLAKKPPIVVRYYQTILDARKRAEQKPEK